MNATFRQICQEPLKAPRCPRHGDSRIACVLGHPELAHAEGEHRWIGPLEVETARVDLAEVEQELRGQGMVFGEEPLGGGEELAVGERVDGVEAVRHERPCNMGVLGPSQRLETALKTEGRLYETACG